MSARTSRSPIAVALALAVTASTVATGTWSSAATVNLVSNPGLEQRSGTAPTCWQRTGYGVNTATWKRSSPGRTGTSAETVTISSYSSGDRKLLPALDASACAPAVTGGRAYRATQWYRSTKPVRFAAYVRSSTGAWTYFASAPTTVPASAGWAVATWTLPALPSGARSLSVGLALAAVGTLTVDDLSVTEAPPTPVVTPSPVVTPPPVAGPTAPAGGAHTDGFDGYPHTGTITDWSTYRAAAFPYAGTSGPANPSAVWEADTGWLRADRGWGWTGRPLDWGAVVGDPGTGTSGRYFFRLNTRARNVVDQDVSWLYKSARYGLGGYPVAAGDAVAVWLRYRSQYDTYIVQFDRTNGGFVAKRKVPALGWKGPAGLIANKGVYYSLRTDEQQPVFGAGQQFISWKGIAPALPAAERDKPGFPDLARDGSSTGGTVYAFRATARTLADGAVRLQLFRGGALVGSWTDRGNGVAANGQTLSSHLAAGYFSTVTGWQAAWGRPITTAGATGFRADNVQAWFDAFSFTEGR